MSKRALNISLVSARALAENLLFLAFPYAPKKIRSSRTVPPQSRASFLQPLPSNLSLPPKIPYSAPRGGAQVVCSSSPWPLHFSIGALDATAPARVHGHRRCSPQQLAISVLKLLLMPASAPIQGARRCHSNPMWQRLIHPNFLKTIMSMPQVFNPPTYTLFWWIRCVAEGGFHTLGYRLAAVDVSTRRRYRTRMLAGQTPLPW